MRSFVEWADKMESELKKPRKKPRKAPKAGKNTNTARLYAIKRTEIGSADKSFAEKGNKQISTMVQNITSRQLADGAKK